jgi:hypothetical protein
MFKFNLSIRLASPLELERCTSCDQSGLSLCTNNKVVLLCGQIIIILSSFTDRRTL